MTLPLYEQIRRDLEGRIVSGEWPPGTRIPFEHELTARYGCARMTAGRALAALAEAGLIERRRRAGSFVARPRPRAMVMDVPDLDAEIAARTGSYAFSLTLRAIRAPTDANERALAGQGDLIELAGEHRSGQSVLLVERRLIALAAVPAAVDYDAADCSPGRWLLSHVPWSRIETRFDAVNADAALARAFEVPRGAACLQIERRTWAQGVPITIVRQVFAPGAVDLIATAGN